MDEEVNTPEDVPEDPPSDWVDSYGDFDFSDFGSKEEVEDAAEQSVADTDDTIEESHGSLDDLLDDDYSDDAGRWSDYIGRQVDVDGQTYVYAGDNMGYSYKDEDGVQHFLTTSELEDLDRQDAEEEAEFEYIRSKEHDRQEKLALNQRSQDLKDQQKRTAELLGSRNAYSAALLRGEEIPQWVHDYYSNWHGQNDFKNLQEFRDMMEQVQGYTDEDKAFFDKALHADDRWYQSLGNALSKAFGGGDSITGYTKSGGVADWNGDGKTSILERVGNTVRNIVTNNGKNLTDFNGDNKVSLLDGLVSGLWNVGQRAVNLGGNLVLPGTSLGDLTLGSLHGITTDDYGRKNSVGEALKEYATNFGKSAKEQAIGLLGTGLVNPLIDETIGIGTGVDWLGHADSLLSKGANALKDYALGKMSNDVYSKFEDMISGDSDDNSDVYNSDSNGSGLSFDHSQTLNNSQIERLRDSMSQTKYDSKRAEWKAKHGDPESAVAVSDERLKSFIVSGFLGMDKKSEVLRKAMLFEAFGGRGPKV